MKVLRLGIVGRYVSCGGFFFLAVVALAQVASAAPSEPPAHLEPAEEGASRLMRIRPSSSNPGEAWLKIRYKGHWFYIANDDFRSREMFTLVDAIFASVVGTVPGSKPLLTLPVR